MNNIAADQLYNLLPALYRSRDVQHGGILQALLAVMAEQAGVVEADIAQLYENAFIETCDEWVVPYIGDLLDVRPLHPIGSNASLRGYVANTLAYRRRKGTAPVLEQLARDVSGWRARAVEFFQLLSTTQHVNHVRLQNLRTPDLRQTNQLELLGGPFETTAHTAELRRIASTRGTYNIPNIGLFLWRLQSYALARVTARAVTDPPDGRYTFDPLGFDTPLFNRPQTETEITHLAEEVHVPGPLRRRPLYDALEARRQALVDGEIPHSLYFGEPPVLQIFVDDQTVAVPPEEIAICHLGDPPAPLPEGWQRPSSSRAYTRFDGTIVQRPIRVAVDPVLGRLAFPAGVTPSQVLVSYAYGFSADVGAGPYDRRISVAEVLTRPVTWQVGVSKVFVPAPNTLFATLAEAVQAWNAQPPGSVGVIALLDSQTYAENLTGVDAITLPEGSQLVLVAAHWPEVDVPDTPGLRQRRIGQFVPQGLRPHIVGNVAVTGTAVASSPDPGELLLHGVLIEGILTVLPGNLGSVRVVHTTLVPSMGGLVVESAGIPVQQNTQLRVTLERSICGPITLPDTVAHLRLVDSIVDRAGAAAITAPGAMGDIRTSTVFGSSRLRNLEASESLFTDTLLVQRRQTGCVRFSAMPAGSRTPRRYRCQPDLALQNVTDPSEQARICAHLTPAFTSTQYGHPAYAQLSHTCAEELRTGTEDDAEMGVFHHLQQPQRIANIRSSSAEYLRVGLEVGMFFVT